MPAGNSFDPDAIEAEVPMGYHAALPERSRLARRTRRRIVPVLTLPALIRQMRARAVEAKRALSYARWANKRLYSALESNRKRRGARDNRDGAQDDRRGARNDGDGAQNDHHGALDDRHGARDDRHGSVTHRRARRCVRVLGRLAYLMEDLQAKHWLLRHMLAQNRNMLEN